MGAVGIAALIANVGVAFMLYRFREGESDRQSVWICSRNDAIANVAVVGAAFGVFGTGTAWPDLIVAAIMATISISGGAKIVRLAWGELSTEAGLPKLIREGTGRIMSAWPRPEENHGSAGEADHRPYRIPAIRLHAFSEPQPE